MVLTAFWVAQWSASDRESALLHTSPDGHQWSRARFEQLTAGLATDLLAAGYGPGRRVVVALPATAAAVVTLVSILRAGACVVPCDPRATVAQADEIVAVVNPDLVISEDAADARWSDTSMATPAQLRRRWQSAGEPVDRGKLDRSASDDLGLICLTSGTTGSSKAVPMTMGQLLAGMRSLVEIWDWTEQDVLISALPLHHVHGLVVAVGGSLTASSQLVLEASFDPQLVARDAIDCGATMIFGVPTMWWRLERDGVVGRMPRLRLAVSGSAPLDPALFARLTAALGSPPVERYGMTETLILTSNPIDGPRKPGSVGLSLPGMKLRVADDGVIEVRGDTVMSGYLNRPEGEGFTDDGWFRTGDLGEFDSDGYLFLRGRASDLIISGGHNVHPAEVEAALASVPGIAELAVAGLPDEQWGQVVAAFVVLGPAVAADPRRVDATLAGLRSRAEAMTTHQQPRRWVVMASLPRNSMGKVVRVQLVRDQVVRDRVAQDPLVPGLPHVEGGEAHGSADGRSR